MKDNQQLLQGLKNSDAKAFEALFNTHYVALCAFASRYLRDTHKAKELVQDAFIKLWELRDKFETESKIRSFLYIAVRNKALNLIDSATYKKIVIGIEEDDLPESDAAAPDHRVKNIWILKEIWEELKSFPDEQKKIFYLIFWHGMETSEVAELLGISASTVRNQKARGIKRLQAKLDGHVKFRDIEFLLILTACLLEERISTLF